MNINTPITSCVVSPSALQSNISYYYSLVNGYITGYMAQGKSAELFGKKSIGYYNKINNFYYLLQWMIIVAEQRQIDLNNNITNPVSYYANQFTCYIDYFKCLNIDIIPLLTVFNLSGITACTGAIAIGNWVINDGMSDQPPCDIFTIS